MKYYIQHKMMCMWSYLLLLSVMLTRHEAEYSSRLNFVVCTLYSSCLRLLLNIILYKSMCVYKAYRAVISWKICPWIANRNTLVMHIINFTTKETIFHFLKNWVHSRKQKTRFIQISFSDGKAGIIINYWKFKRI